MTKDPGEVLASARRYVHDKDYCNALEAYEYFFDHALDEDPAAFYGVRLSYCLDEWARLGKVFPAAQERLKEKRNSTLKALHDERNPELFHDYQSICEYLGSPEVPVKEFLRLHGSDPELAKSCKRFIWENLIENEHWEVCGSYLDSPKSDLKNAFSKFDQSMTICMSDPSLGGETFENQIRQWFVRDVSNILLVLRNCERERECAEIRELARSGIEERGYGELSESVVERLRSTNCVTTFAIAHSGAPLRAGLHAVRRSILA